MKNYGEVQFAMFQLTPPRGGRQAGSPASTRQSRFQLTPPRRGRHPRRNRPFSARRFNSRPREGGDQFPAAGFAAMAVSTHAPAKGATSPMSPRRSLRVFQLTPPRRGRPLLDEATFAVLLVSTHAPAKGATILGVPPAQAVVVSTHAPAKGATGSR